MARINSIRHNGLINAKAVDVRLPKDGKGVQLTIKKKRAVNKPVKAKSTTIFTKVVIF